MHLAKSFYWSKQATQGFRMSILLRLLKAPKFVGNARFVWEVSEAHVSLHVTLSGFDLGCGQRSKANSQNLHGSCQSAQQWLEVLPPKLPKNLNDSAIPMAGARVNHMR